MYQIVLKNSLRENSKKSRVMGFPRVGQKSSATCRQLALVKSQESPACQPRDFFPFFRKHMDCKMKKRIEQTIGIKSCIDSLNFYFARNDAGTEHVG